MYEKEEVNENEVKQFAEEIWAFFEINSTKNNTGINVLFMHAANKFVAPNYNGKAGELKEENNLGNGNIKLEEKEQKIQKKKTWC